MKYIYSVFTVRKITLQLRRGVVIDIWLQCNGGKLMSAFPSPVGQPQLCPSSLAPVGSESSRIFCEISQFKNVKKNFKMLKREVSHYCMVRMKQNNGQDLLWALVFNLCCNTVDVVQ